MEDEIKEILNKLNNMMTFDENLIGWQIDGNGTTISKKDFKILLDYITNLEEENKRLRKNINNAKEFIEQHRIREMSIVEVNALEGILNE